PSNDVWKKINRNLFFKRFLKFNPATFNIYYTLLIGIISAFAVYNITNTQNNKLAKNNHPIEKEITINKQTPTNKKYDNNKTEIIKEKKEANTKSIIKNKNINNNIEKTTQIKISANEIVDNVITKENANSEPIKNNNLKLAEPSADFSASTYEACEPATITFTNTSENCDRFLWNFGDESSSEEANPTFVFKSAGEYTVMLTVYSGGILDTITKTIKVFSKPKAEFIIADKNDIFVNDEIKFANLSTNFNSCKWDFGDDNTSDFTHPSHAFEKAGLYDVSLICTSEDNCSDTSTIINLQVKDDKYKIYAPTALSPDISGESSGYSQKNINSNSVFKPIFNTEPAKYYLRIFNKFGSVVFESRDINYGWNGYYNNKPAPVDVYIWECTGKFSDGKPFIKTGNLTVLYLRNQ
ncbi:MAG: PKD domain-containing protein, partial [Chlorobi bacterium]|nr:PKD domain-containing protein [Chlorobiota bacterium]